MSVVSSVEVPAWCARYIGLPFVERGRATTGVDCWGLLVLVYAEVFGITLRSYVEEYPSTRDRVAVARVFFAETTRGPWRRVPVEAARIPDVFAMRVAGAAHVGLVVAPERFLHVLPGRETCVDRLRPFWAPRVEACYRHEAVP